jgi:hypothetical protein
MSLNYLARRGLLDKARGGVGGLGLPRSGETETAGPFEQMVVYTD